MKKRSKLRTVVAGANIALAIVAWVAFAPKALGGSVSYVITHGISMKPRIHEGDLVLVRESDTYTQGDVIAYDSTMLKQPVLHRIVSGGPNGYVTKGDNNDWFDSDRPSDADVIGKEWIHIPKAGRVLALVGTPVGAAVLAGIGGLLIFAGHSMSRTRGRRRTTMPKIDTSRLADANIARQFAFGAVALGVVASLVLAYMSLTADPVTLQSGGSSYTHTGEFTYEATAPEGDVYPDGKATTGEPLFLQLIDEVDVAFTYRLEAEASADIAGAAMLWLRVTDGTGWQDSFPLQTKTEFGGAEIQVSDTIRPERIQDRVATVQEQTGVVSSPITVTLIPTVDIVGTIGGATIEDRFQPHLELSLDGPQMKLGPAAESSASDPNASASDPLQPRQDGDAGETRIAPAQLSLLGIDLSVRNARLLAFVGLAASLAAGWWLYGRSTRGKDDDEDAAIAAGYGEWLIPVAPPATRADSAIEVTSIEGLVRLAERYERMILHSENGSGHRYMVEDAGVLYYYETGDGLGPAPAFETPARREDAATQPAKVVATSKTAAPAKTTTPVKHPRATTSSKIAAAKSKAVDAQETLPVTGEDKPTRQKTPRKTTVHKTTTRRPKRPTSES